MVFELLYSGHEQVVVLTEMIDAKREAMEGMVGQYMLC
jgi:hypothetical protein